MIRGIDNDEATFLEFASQQQAEMDGRRFAVTSEIKEFRISFECQNIVFFRNYSIHNYSQKNMQITCNNNL